MSAFKSHKTELVAIYRLEFYKKQKNWKLSNDVRKTPRRTPKPKIVLNKTYNIEIEPEKECNSDLNQGFLEEKPENKVCEQEIKDNPEQEQITIGLSTPANDNVQCEQNSYCNLVCMDPNQDDQNWQDAEQEWYDDPEWPEAMLPQQYECGAGEMGWPNAGLDWAQDSLNPQPDWPQVDMTGEGQPIDNMLFPQQWDEPQYRETEQPSLWTQCDMGSELCHKSSSTDSFTEFIRGAHAAPHSSEVDLLQDTGSSSCSCSLYHAHASRLSARQLAAGVCAHSRALTLLLHETALRNQCAVSTPPPMLQHPSGPLHRGVTFTTDAECGGGRGRGRLRDKEKLIGIGMGRPYRL